MDDSGFTREDFIWHCKECGTENHIFKLDCNRCHRQRSNPFILKDWNCPRCHEVIFAKKDQCKKCSSRRGDWVCQACRTINFAKREICLRCHLLKPKEKLVC